ncbi:MAG TPA: hypothetical protein VGM25_11485 [Caulobacteraceae bacterium]
MSQNRRWWVLAGAMMLASCGRPDSTGVYLSKSDREVDLIQLAQAKDGAVTGRLEVISVGQGGVVNDRSAKLDGAASKHDLVFKPTDAWFGGVAGSGAFDRGSLTISHNGSELKARKGSLDEFQKLVGQLNARATMERHRADETKADRAAQVAQAAAIKDAGDKAARLQEAAAQLRADAAKLNDAVAAAPDFGQQSVGNTARIGQMAQSAATLSRKERGRLSAQANQVIVGTNQIDVARTQYAVGLNQIIQHASPIATDVERFCDTPQASPFAKACAEAKTAATGFESALVRASVMFKGYKQTVQTELARQNQLAGRIGG